jgi:ABC-type transporter Mla MlaB component
MRSGETSAQRGRHHHRSCEPAAIRTPRLSRGSGGALPPGVHLVLDFGTIQTIDSAGVGALVAILKAVRKIGGRMVLIGIHPQVLSVLKTIRLTTVFEIHADEAAALAALESTPITSR